MGEVGTTYSVSDSDEIGVANLTAEVTALSDGVSTFKGSAIVTNQVLKNLLSNVPEISFNGDTAVATNVKIKQSKEGIQLLSGPTPGVLIKYDAEVGDTYPVGNGDYERRVVSKSTEEDFYYGFYMIEVIEVEESTTQYKSSGIHAVTYYFNHLYGLVGVNFCMDDDTDIFFVIYSSAEN